MQTCGYELNMIHCTMLFVTKDHSVQCRQVTLCHENNFSVVGIVTSYELDGPVIESQ